MLHTISEQKDSIYNQCPDKLFICKDELATYAFADSHVHLLNAVWNILIKKDFIKKNNLHFETECGFCDDYVFTHTMIPLVTKAVLISNITYYWIIRDGSQSNKTETTISSKPFRNAIIANNLLKDYCLSLKQKPYYEGYCLRIQKESFLNAHAMIKLRKRLDKPISNKEIKDSISPIESLRNIIRFKKLKREHLIFFFLGKMPFYILPISFKVLFRFRNSR